METIIIQGESKKAIDLLVELSRQLNLKQKKITKAELEDLFLAESIDEGRKSGYVSKQRVLKALKK
jgi:hypothetical protein